MQLLTIGKNQAGQRLDKYLKKALPGAGTGFLYKMLRKKNITLNGKKAEGKEKLSFNCQMLPEESPVIISRNPENMLGLTFFSTLPTIERTEKTKRLRGNA